MRGLSRVLDLRGLALCGLELATGFLSCGTGYPVAGLVAVSVNSPRESAKAARFSTLRICSLCRWDVVALRAVLLLMPAETSVVAGGEAGMVDKLRSNSRRPLVWFR
jgi:hypothetical protein